MFIKLFRAHGVRVPDPLRPGRSAVVPPLVAAGTAPFEDAGVTYAPDDDGWVEVPEELGARLRQFRFPGGERFCTPTEVNEEVRLGRAPAAVRRKGARDGDA